MPAGIIGQHVEWTDEKPCRGVVLAAQYVPHWDPCEDVGDKAPTGPSVYEYQCSCGYKNRVIFGIAPVPLHTNERGEILR